MIKPLTLLLLCCLTAACTKQNSLSQYSYRDVGQSTIVEFGTLLSSKPVGITGKNSGAGSMGGGLIGLAAGSNVGGGNGQLAAAVGGAIVGAVAGSVAEQALANSTGVEYIITKENGETITIVQNLGKGEAMIPTGKRVMVQTSGSYQRVIPADTIPETIKRPKGVKLTD